MANHLSEHQISQFRQRLKDRFRQLRREISAELMRADQEQYLELAGLVHDTEEEAVADLLVDVNLASVDRHVQEIRAIDQALLRMATGVYGECSDCEEPIPLERLQVNPTAERCVSCQEAYDRGHAHLGRPTL